jgi:hypothetical protein
MPFQLARAGPDRPDHRLKRTKLPPEQQNHFSSPFICKMVMVMAMMIVVDHTHHTL